MYSAEKYFIRFLIIWSNSEQCHVNFTVLLSHCEHIGVPINNEIKI